MKGLKSRYCYIVAQANLFINTHLAYFLVMFQNVEDMMLIAWYK